MVGKAVAKAQSKPNVAVGKSKKPSDDDAYVSKNKGKKEGDENKIKRPLSSYFMYCNERRETLKKEQPSLGMTDQIKKMSEEWKNLDAKKKKKYEDMNAKDKDRYENEKAAAGQTDNKKKKPTGAAAVVEEGEKGPKKPLSSYFFYIEERRETIKKDHPSLDHKDILKTMGKEWNELEPKKKEKYEKKAKEAKEKYEVEKKKFDDGKVTGAGGAGAANNLGKRKAPEPVAKKGATNGKKPAEDKKGAKKGKQEEEEEEEGEGEEG